MLGRALLFLSESPRMERFVTQGRLSRPVVKRFVAGDSLEDAVSAIGALNQRRIGGILDLLGEGVADPAGVRAAAEEYSRSLGRAREAGLDTTISVKPSQLGLQIDPAQCLVHLRRLAGEAAAMGTLLEIDMEHSSTVAATLEAFRALRADHENVRLAIQAYLHRTPADLEAMKDLAPRVRLVKGAYAEPPERAIQRKPDIDAAYRQLTDWLFAHGTDPAIATHDERLIEHARAAAERSGAGPRGYEIQMLYGIRADLQERLVQQGTRVRTYVPFGAAWYPYLMRRMAERPANLRFFLRALLGA